MTTDELFNEVKEFAFECGMVCDENKKDHTNKSINAVVRKNYGNDKESDEDSDKSKDNSDYFGFIKEHNGPKGKYEDLSLVFFPHAINNELSSCIIALGVGTLGLPNDLGIASLPGTRRLFNRLGGKYNSIEGEDPQKFFIKNDFTDITSDVVNETIESVNNNCIETTVSIPKISKKYNNYIQTGYILTIDDFEGKTYSRIVKRWIATYADFRLWLSKTQKTGVLKGYLPDPKGPVLDILKTQNSSDSIEDILYRDRFIVLQGAPGTGKTYSALKIWDNCFIEGNRFFEQFHAETTFSDFVYGIKPKLDNACLEYTPNVGILLKAIDRAKTLEEDYKNEQNIDKKNFRVLLIIDEINRANLSNVLGPVFFLFEKNRENTKISFDYDNNVIFDHLPENLFVIATMNTADRSLAVVDFALRRRFTWLTIKPHVLSKNDLPQDKLFMDDVFEVFNKAFDKYATDEELNLQPGQSYFIVNKNNKDKEMENRLKYELMPLIKEYFNEGYLSNAKNYFYNYFYKEIGELIYE